MKSVKQITPGIAVEPIPFPTLDLFDFSQINPGESFLVRAGGGKTARQNRDRTLGQACAWLRKNAKDAHFRSGDQQPDGAYRIFMIAGKRVYPAKKDKPIW
ncbi:MAG: hypothetical protein OIF58_00150 [Cohaesibacter sp.]|nr:hypothetical protein [Cohaesibacter sp.]MCV6600108.1 hypothetical protein [Cohaesibacter sp.]